MRFWARRAGKFKGFQERVARCFLCVLDEDIVKVADMLLAGELTSYCCNESISAARRKARKDGSVVTPEIQPQLQPDAGAPESDADDGTDDEDEGEPVLETIPEASRIHFAQCGPGGPMRCLVFKYLLRPPASYTPLEVDEILIWKEGDDYFGDPRLLKPTAQFFKVFKKNMRNQVLVVLCAQRQCSMALTDAFLCD